MSSAAAEAEPARARPGSGGLRALLSWLRRDDAGSSDSLSSVGSDRTAASFSFLAPERCRQRTAPLLRAPPPPTDSYRKRLRERNLRLQHDRDLTLHRKYGLFRGENSGYDAFSLPSARKRETNENRERRAASECLQRRAAHVPGKRRAPPPPARAATLSAPRRSRKRPAPQPPRRPLSEAILNATIPEENLTQMSAKLGQDEPLPRNDALDCKPEKYIKKEVKDPKTRTEKSFLKQIFESRKRNSSIDTVPERILPNISELDKQAYEIIESCKLKAFNGGSESAQGNNPELQMRSKGDMWFCTRCLRKYNDSVVTCVHCVTEQKKKLKENDQEKHSASNHYTQTETPCAPSTSRITEAEEKQKLKDMLKEIKDSLPKKPKHDVKNNNSTNILLSTTLKASVVDAPTLRIGSKTNEEEKKAISKNNDLKLKNVKAETNHDIKVTNTNTETSSATERAVVTQPIVLQHSPSRDFIKLENFKVSYVSNGETNIKPSKAANTELKEVPYNKNQNPKESNTRNEFFFYNDPLSTHNNINTPLKISSLFNSHISPERHLTKGAFCSQTETQNQPQIEVQTQPSDNKPILSSSIPTTMILNFPQSLSTIAPSRSPKVVEPVQKTKATTTTQTSSGVLLDIKQKQTATGTKELINNEVMKAKNGRDTNAQNNQTQVNTSIIVLDPSASCLNGASPSITASPQHKPITNKKETKAEDIANLNVKIKDKRIIDRLQNPAGESGPLKLEISEQPKPATKIIPLDQHLRRRDLINQLEQSIAQGDERAAADAAAKLAQLRLSCSVLSFSSQIVGGASSNAMSEKNNIPYNTHIVQKVQTPAAVQSQEGLIDKLQNSAASTSKTLAGKEIIPGQFESKDCEKKIILQANNNRQTFTEEPSTSKLNDGLGKNNDIVSIEVWIEDKEAARGPIRMNMPRTSVVGDLRRQADTTLGLAANLQRWIVGRTLCTNANTPLNEIAGPEFNAPFYLCLVEPETHKQPASGSKGPPSATTREENRNQPSGNNSTDVYSELVLLERRALVPNTEEFECGVCMETYRAGEGTVLRECMHTFCRECLCDVVKHCEEAAVGCPAAGCRGALQEREVRALVSPAEYERWLARGLAAAESGSRNAFHCRTRDCSGWALCEPGVTRFPCPVCKRTNCVFCQAIHEGETCEQYRAKQVTEVANQGQAQADEGTRAFLDTLISRGEALECPECSAIITKKWGCDWIKCSACKTEICWVTRGRRWGPAGRGDTSAGCRCGVEGRRCHPSCGYCH